MVTDNLNAKLARMTMTESAMTDQQYRALANFIRMVADKLGLRDWQFFLEQKFMIDPPDKLATTHIWGDSKTASLEFSKDFFELGPRMQVEIVCHELIHWHVEPGWRLVRAIAQDHMAPAAVDVFRTAFEQHMEFSVDAISCAWAREFPAINWNSRAKLYFDAKERREKPPDKLPH